jgi:hypothetical protein
MPSHNMNLPPERHQHIIHINGIIFVTALFARWSQDGGYAVVPSVLTTILAIVFSLA